MKCNQSCPGFELVSSCPFPTTTTNTPRARPTKLVIICILCFIHTFGFIFPITLPIQYFYPSTYCELFTPTLADHLSRESEWQHVFSSHQDSPQYYNRSWQYCRLDGLDLSSDLQLFQLSVQTFGNRCKWANYNWYHHHSHVAQLFYSSLTSFIYFANLSLEIYIQLFLFPFLFPSYRCSVCPLLSVLFLTIVDDGQRLHTLCNLTFLFYTLQKKSYPGFKIVIK